MPAVSQALAEFANRQRSLAAPGVEVIATPRYVLTLQPDRPWAGPNGVSWVRCSPQDAEDLIDEVHAAAAARRVPLMWVLDPEVQPRDFASVLRRRGILPDRRSPEALVMALAIDHEITVPHLPGLSVHDALADATVFQQADAVAAEAFGAPPAPRTHEATASQERARLNQVSAGNRRLFLITLDAEPAGSAGLTLLPPGGAILNGGAVAPSFRGRGIYRALVAARQAAAREAGAAGLIVWGGPMSAPILTRLGFATVGSRLFYLDTSTGPQA